MEGLFNPITILWHVANAALLFVAVYFLLYKPVRKFMAQREAKVAGVMEEANRKLEEARQAADNGDQVIADAHRKAEEDAEERRKLAAEQEKKILAAAQAKADEIIGRAQREADAILKNARQEMRVQAADLAVEIAKSILEREFDRADHEKLMEEAFRKVEA